jgi:hypothetical protein
MGSQQFVALCGVSEGNHRATQPYHDNRQYTNQPLLSTSPTMPSIFARREYDESFSPDSIPGYLGEEYGDHDTLQFMAQSRLPSSPHSTTWEYKLRHKATRVTPYLYLGPSPEAKNAEMLNAIGIGLLVAVRGAKLARAQPKYLNPAYFTTATNRRTMTVDFDSPTEFVSRLKPALKAVVDYVRDAVALGEEPGILVFCETGNTRSVAFAAALTMAVYGFNHFNALQFLLSRRGSICLEDEYTRMLQSLNDVLVATRQVRAATQGIPRKHNENKKRSLENDSDEEMADGEGGTAGQAPFMDGSG